MKAVGRLMSKDKDEVEERVARYKVGLFVDGVERQKNGWTQFACSAGNVKLLHCAGGADDYVPPFIYEWHNAKFLTEFVDRFGLDKLLASASGEYDAVVRLSEWLGMQWEHGTDVVPGGRLVCDPIAVVMAGRGGSRFWCEIAARTAVHAFAALGWVSRIVTASRDGYTWEHAVAEIWINEFSKWMLVDTDFNVIYECDGVPLSAWDLCHHGPQMQREATLSVRRFARIKDGIHDQDLLPYYAYIHVDMRTDWCSREIRRGSPAGGDLATWWSARPLLDSVVTAAVRIQDSARFNWNVNFTNVYVRTASQRKLGDWELEVGLGGYSPVFSHFELNIDSRGWVKVDGATAILRLLGGNHNLKARMCTVSGFYGAQTEIAFRIVSELQQ